MKHTAKHATQFLALIILSTLCTYAVAASTTQSSKKAGLHGKVEKVDGTKITILTKGVETVIDTDDNTKFFLDNKPATLEDVKANERLTAMPETGVATEVRLTTGKKHGANASTEPASDAK